MTAMTTPPAGALDPRVTPARADIAALWLQGRVTAERFVEGQPMRVVAPLAPMRTQPAANAPRSSDMIMGETVYVYDEQAGFAWVQAAHDSYVGWVALSALGPPAVVPPTHRVIRPRSLRFVDPDLHSQVLGYLYMNSALTPIARAKNGFLELIDGGFVFAHHVAPLTAFATNPLAVARLFLTTPYLWGGCTAGGIDCSGLVQTALIACGYTCPRDSDQQAAMLAGTDIPSLADSLPGDLAFFPGHVAFIDLAGTVLHATGHWLETVNEPLDDVIRRGNPVGRILRLPPVQMAR